MINTRIEDGRPHREVAAAETFLKSPTNESFTELFLTFTPQLVSFFRSHGCRLDLSEDLSQEVMLTVYRKVAQLRDRRKQFAEAVSADLENVADTRTKSLKPSAFEFHHWMRFLKSHESEALILRFVEEWEYHEIAAATASPIGTVQWRVFNAKRTLATQLKAPARPGRKAA
jgi:DNA-directed RNA polymerase specialized sigma24 family protein